jgi:hypothetical protein
MNDQTQAQQLNQRVEREIRYVIGELTVQNIVLRQMLELGAQSEPRPEQREKPEKPTHVNGGGAM